MRAIPLLVFALLLGLAPAVPAAEIKRVSGGSTASAAYVEVAFKGDAATRVKVKLVPETGRATTIRAAGRGLQLNTRRRGTKGFTEVVRAGRTMAVLVRGLSTVAGEVVVTASRPGKVDKQRRRLRPLRTQGQLELELERTDRALRRLSAALSSASYRAFDARKKAKRARLNLLRAGLTARIETLEGWIKVVDKALSGLAKRECNDGVDGGDPEDSIADFGSDKDPGCVMPLDNDEGDAPLTVTCPSPGGSATASAALTFAQSNELERFVLSLPPPAPDEPRLSIVDETVTGTRGGPYPMETGITQLCNYDFDLTYSYAVFTDGLPAGMYGLRVTVTAQNNGGFPGGEQLPFRLAAGTTR